MHLPEQGITGPFRITSIKHLLPQKKPIDEDPTDEYGYRPVTAIFTHVSDQVFRLTFEDGKTLGVTARHPIYSATWRVHDQPMLVSPKQNLPFKAIRTSQRSLPRIIFSLAK
ncbi:hypothetical protein QWY85_14925 [Neolewinella lacunae]|uniref:Uncharacterized protein n=1 Tax=Neolewinella lacunae TaxID=1517758 RepID=A0A923PJ74_9BACT|nr:hypothetical protein [Neolewinella lacunae]MBC6992716.1 hypothetical protein [Neolewinella lacunae]MDN3635960.1 hypothetical protein [Neolewinella lacunae]